MVLVDPNHNAIVYGNLCISYLTNSCKTSVLLIVFLDANVEAGSTGTKCRVYSKLREGINFKMGTEQQSKVYNFRPRFEPWIFRIVACFNEISSHSWLLDIWQKVWSVYICTASIKSCTFGGYKLDYRVFLLTHHTKKVDWL